MDYSHSKFSKGTPRVLVKAQKVQTEEAHRKKIKAAVWKRDGARCRVCGDPATEMHELEFRSLGGQRSTENSIATCAFGSAHNCHRYLQTHCIEVEGTNADKRLVFRWAGWVKPELRTFKIKSKRRSQNSQ